MDKRLKPGHRSAAWPLALCYVALIAYASLFPFAGWRDQGLSPLAYLQAPWPQYWTRFDLLSNLLGYMPLGFLLALAMLRMRWRWPSVLLAGAAAAALSLWLEALQTYLPQRVASNLDLGLNAAGGLAGAVLAFVLERLGAIDRWRRFRARWFVPDSRGALLLLLLWPVGLLFPPPVAFGMGQVLERAEDALARLLLDTPFLDWLPVREMELQPLLPTAELACVALGLLAPCLLGYAVIRHRGRRALFALAALLAGVAVSALSAGLTYGPVHAWAWVSRPVTLGIQLAALLAALALWLPHRACALALLLVLAVQVALLNTAPQGAYFAQTLQSWEQGRFIHFHGLAQWVGWLWPFAAFAYLLHALWRRQGAGAAAPAAAAADTAGGGLESPPAKPSGPAAPGPHAP